MPHGDITHIDIPVTDMAQSDDLLRGSLRLADS